jgi:NADH-quinone oxidoreductase subunit L
MMAGTLAITGVGIYWLHAGFAGFHSKDAILEAAFARGTESGNFAFFMGAFAALLTSFYSWRLMFLTFFGDPRWAGSEHIQHAMHHDAHEEPMDAEDEDSGSEAHEHNLPAKSEGTAGYDPHESPLSMLIPLGALSIGAIAAGWVFSHAFLDSTDFWNGSIYYNERLVHAMHAAPLWVKLTATVVMLIGLFAAWLAYIRDPGLSSRAADQLGPVYRFFCNKWYFDELYNAIFVRPAFWLGRQFWQRGDVGIIDRFGPNGAAWVVAQGAGAAKRFQSGYLTSYALVMLLGLVAAITWVLF